MTNLDSQRAWIPRSSRGMTNKKIIITGSTGFVGSELVPFLLSAGHTVLCLHRTYQEQLKDAEDFDAVIHLAGENVASKKWTEERKKELIESRVKFTHGLLVALKQLNNPPKIFICASGIGIFGNRHTNEICDENSKPGSGFLAELAQQWEKATEEAKNIGMRVVNLRFGSILASSGGMLQKMILPYKLFLGGPFGTGKQHLPWISLKDVLNIILFSLSNAEIKGPLNVVAPQIVSNKEFSNELAHVLKRPNILRLPEFLIDLFFGEKGRELFLTDIVAEPKKLQNLGYAFIHPHLKDALAYYLKS